MKRLLLGATLLVAACASQPLDAQLATGCNAAASIYRTAAANKAKLSVGQIKILTDGETLVSGLCDPTNPPTNLNSALTTLNAFLAKWAAAQ